jgi:hypothetical protein
MGTSMVGAEAQPEREPAPRSRGRFVRSVVALAIASGFGIGLNVFMLPRTPPVRHGWEALEDDVEPFVSSVSRASVVGVLVQGGPASANQDQAIIRIAQYVFTPVRVRGISWVECVRFGVDPCGLTRVDHVIVDAPPGEQLARWGGQFGFALTRSGRQFSMLSRVRR